jgi:hypothetical protein
VGVAYLMYYPNISLKGLKNERKLHNYFIASAPGIEPHTPAYEAVVLSH